MGEASWVELAFGLPWTRIPDPEPYSNSITTTIESMITCVVHQGRVRVGLVRSHKVRNDSKLRLEVVQHHLRQEEPRRHVTDSAVLLHAA